MPRALKGWLLVVATLVPLLLTASCSAVALAPDPVRPPRPEGRPADDDAELRAATAAWVYSGGKVTMPQADSRKLIRRGNAWRAYAQALEGSVAWAETSNVAVHPGPTWTPGDR